MPNFAKKCRKQLHRFLYSKVCSCVCSGDLTDQLDPPSTPSELVVSQKLEILLLKTLKNQIAEQEYHDQLKHTLLQIVQILEQVGQNYSLHRKLSRRFSSEGFPKFTITVSEGSVLHCQTDGKNKSLVVVNARSIDRVGRGNSVVLHKCQKNLFHVSGSIIPNGGFSSTVYRVSDDKAVQYDSRATLRSPSLTDSKLVQTQLLHLSKFNLTSFKLDLVKHMRVLKHDVLSLRQLLYGLEQYPVSCKLNAKAVSVFTPNEYWNEEFEYKFFEAKVRAANFVKFYKLRKAGEGKKRAKGRGGGKSVSLKK